MLELHNLKAEAQVESEATAAEAAAAAIIKLKLIAFRNARHVAQFIKITWPEGRAGMGRDRSAGTITCYG